MSQVVIILGSENDKQVVEESKMLDVLHGVGVSWKLSIISAHRNHRQLVSYCFEMEKDGTLVFIAAAGMAAVLPGAIASYIRHRPVIGVPLISEVLDGQDALFSMVRMPEGIPVAVSGIGKSGLYNAAILACQIVAIKDSTVEANLEKFLIEKEKIPQISVLSSKES